MKSLLMLTTVALISAGNLTANSTTVSVTMHGDDSVLNGNVRSSVVARLRRMPDMTVVADDANPEYSVVVSVARVSNKTGQGIGWNGAFALESWITCDGIRAGLLRYVQVAGGGTSSENIDSVITSMVDQFDEMVFTPDRHPVTTPPSN